RGRGRQAVARRPGREQAVTRSVCRRDSPRTPCPFPRTVFTHRTRGRGVRVFRARETASELFSEGKNVAIKPERGQAPPPILCPCRGGRSASAGKLGTLQN